MRIFFLRYYLRDSSYFLWQAAKPQFITKSGCFGRTKKRFGKFEMKSLRPHPFFIKFSKKNCKYDIISFSRQHIAQQPTFSIYLRRAHKKKLQIELMNSKLLACKNAIRRFYFFVVYQFIFCSCTNFCSSLIINQIIVKFMEILYLASKESKFIWEINHKTIAK